MYLSWCSAADLVGVALTKEEKDEEEEEEEEIFSMLIKCLELE